MTVREKLDILDKISEIAALAGINGTVDEERMHFAAGFHTTQERTQMAYVRPAPEGPTGEPAVTFFSPCLTVKKGLLSGMSKDRAMDLLRRNEKMFFARFGIWSSDDHDMIIASCDHLLSTLDAKEFYNNIYAVAFAADNYEQQHGQDDY